VADPFSKSERSRIMAAVKSKDTVPEIIVRRLVHALGYRFRLHRRDLPGCPDLVLPKLRKVINVHGCFWHVHKCRSGQTLPVNNRRYWIDKRKRNQSRDKRSERALRHLGWRVLVVWTCQTGKRQREVLTRRIMRFLQSGFEEP
jgi:DNA mismatch endonuclease (patch repair protein)